MRMDLWPRVVCNGSWLPYVNDLSLSPMCSEPNVAVLFYCLYCLKSLKNSDILSSQLEDFTSGNSQLYRLSFPCLYLGYFIVPCNPIPPHGYSHLKLLKLKRDGTGGVQNPGLALTWVYVSVCLCLICVFQWKSVFMCERDKRQMFLVWLYPLQQLSECWHD